MELEDYAGAKVVKSNRRSFMLVQKKLSEVNAGRIGDYLLENKGYICPEKISEKFPNLQEANEKDMLFVDIETTGFRHEAVFMIARGYFNGEPCVEIAVARNFLEERAILDYFFETVKQYKGMGNFDMFTYNGSSFDVPNLSERMIVNGISIPQEKSGNIKSLNTFKLMIEKNHEDLYQKVRKEHPELKSKKLQSLEKIVLGHAREKDIPGREIPKIYKDYVYGGGGVDEQKVIRDMHRIIDHNVLDTFSLMGVLAFLCKER